MNQLAGKRGLDLLRDPAFNKGTAFCLAERRALGLEGLLRSNLVLFHRFLANHLGAVLPVVYTPP